MARVHSFASFAVFRPARAVALACVAIALAGCQTLGGGNTLFSQDADPETTGSIANPDQSIVKTARWAKEWQKNPGDINAALKYAANLRRIGSRKKALEVLRETASRNPKNATIVAEYGKQLASMGRDREAGKVLQKAMKLGARDWRIYSAQGTVLDSTGHHARAQQYYGAALKLAPDQPVILNNLGMSYALGGDLANAERTLRTAMSRPGAKPKVRQNLALVLGLQGRYSEAKQIASADLPPEQVEANMKYLRKMMSQQDMWSAVKKSGKRS